MKIFKLKTNLKCNNCVAKVKTQLDEAKAIVSWSIDLTSPDRILTVETNDEGAVALVQGILENAGFHSEICPG